VRLELKKSFITGIFVTGPLVISVAILFWFFEKVDDLFSPVIDGIIRVTFPGAEHIPGTGILAGLVIILIVGLFARNIVGKRILDALDSLINRIPGYRTIYATIKQLTNAFSPDSKRSFKEVLFVEYPKVNSYALGFRTETVEKGGKRFVVVFVPTNNLYLGEVLFIPEEHAVRINMTVEQAIRILISGGTASPKEVFQHKEGA
jgi:uncharacterized membrane protein